MAQEQTQADKAVEQALSSCKAALRALQEVIVEDVEGAHHYVSKPKFTRAYHDLVGIKLALNPYADAGDDEF
jgi:hypothetical protein